MATLLKVIQGTRSLEGERLCNTCHHAHIMRGPADSQEQIHCYKIGGDYDTVPFRVVECNNYSNKRLPSLDDMRRTAWIVSTDPKKKTIGLLSAKEWREQNPKKSLEIPGEWDD